jgi:hypothetical protein
MRAKKTVRRKKPAPRKHSDRLTQFANAFNGAIGRQTIAVRVLAIAGICIFTAAMLVSSRQPSRDAETFGARGADRPLAAASADPLPAELPAAEAFPREEPVTITGCLEQKDEVFRLKNTAGDDAPKARSWKSGFLRKNAATVSVVDSHRRLRLPAHVGERVSVTGVMMNREMQARTLQRVGSCSAKLS